MIVAIQQPEHLPWVGFFNKMVQSDLFVYLDTTQFKKRYFENRNKIKTESGPKWVTVPVDTKSKYTQKINQVEITDCANWIRKYKGQLEHSYKKAKYWDDVKGIVFPALDSTGGMLLDCNMQLIENCRKYLGIENRTVLASELELPECSGSDLILQICIKTNADVYISGPDGRNYLDQGKFKDNNIRIVYHDFAHPEYPQMHGDFISHLSTIDLIANCGKVSEGVIRECYRI